MSSIMAGICIAIAYLCYINIPAPINALIFPIGLYLILWNNYSLFTGKIGFVRKPKDLGVCFLVLLGNVVGCCFAFLAATPQNLAADRVNQPLLLVFFKAALCGYLMYQAVLQYKIRKYAPLLLIVAFLIAGGEHCVADICLILSARYFTWRTLLFTLVVICGNTFGSLFDFYKNICYNICIKIKEYIINECENSNNVQR